MYATYCISVTNHDCKTAKALFWYKTRVYMSKIYPPLHRQENKVTKPCSSFCFQWILGHVSEL